jgi:hypothetical protein
MDMANTKIESKLFSESKSFHTIRILNIFKYDTVLPKDMNIGNGQKGVLLQRINSHAIKYYIDFFFKIENCYSLSEIQYQRSGWKPIRRAKPLILKENTYYSHPLYIVIGSTFDEKQDNKYREVFQVDTDDGYKLIPTTYYGYQNFKFNSAISDSDIENYLQKKYLLLFFQVAGKECQYIEKPRRFFNEQMFSNRMCFDGKFSVLYYGLLKGDIEGFVLFELMPQYNIANLIAILTDANSLFFDGIKPLSLFECSWFTEYVLNEPQEHFSSLPQEFYE